MNKWSKWSLIAALMVAAVGLGAWGLTAVQASPDVLSTSSRAALHPGIGGGVVDMQALLAEALGITVEELEEAQSAARERALADAVEAGLLTQEQADQMLEGRGFFGRGSGRFGRGPRHGKSGGGADFDALLAEELGISVEALEDAQQEAHEAAIDQLVDEGYLTEEQGRLAKAASALKRFIDKDALMAEALGIGVDALQKARAEGKSLSDLLDEQGLDSAAFRENLAAAHEAAIAEAVEAGVISEADVEALEGGFFHGSGFGRGSGHGRHGRGGFGGRGILPRGGPFTPTDGNTVDA